VIRALIVEDEDAMVQLLAKNLEARGFAVSVATSGQVALRMAANAAPEIVLIDLGLPDVDGVEVIEGIRGWSSVPIIVLSARHQEGEKVRALDAGADDYLTKPFGLDEFFARVRANTRRPQPPAHPPTIHTPDFTVDLPMMTCTLRDGTGVHLTRIEWNLVIELVTHPGQVMTHAHLLREVWDISEPGKAHYVRFHMTAVRKKLEPDPARPRYFLTEHGVGVVFDPSGGARDSRSVDEIS
jgi:two-component system, OmpR family, KDP operon response regulator KdpE